MKKQVTLSLSDDLLKVAGEIATRSRKEIEEVLEEWLGRYADELPLETAPDEEVLRQTHFEMNIIQKQELRNLLYAHRIRKLSDAESTRLDELLQHYRRGTIRRTRAIEVAISRGLIDRDAP